MWKYLLILCFAFGALTTEVQAQPEETREERFTRIKEAREAFLKEELSLTAKESEAFFPVFWHYEASIRKGRKSSGHSRHEDASAIEALSETEARELLVNHRKRKQETLALEMEAEDAYLAILSAKKVVLLRRAEREFREKLLRRLRQQCRGEDQN